MSMVKRCTLFLCLLAMSSGELHQEEWKFQLPSELQSLQVLGERVEVEFQNHEGNETANNILVMAEATGVKPTWSMTEGGTAQQRTLNFEHNLPGCISDDNRSPSMTPWWAIILVAVMSGFKLQGNGFRAQGLGLLLFMLLAMAVGTLSEPECPKIKVTVSLPKSVCIKASLDQPNSVTVEKPCAGVEMAALSQPASPSSQEISITMKIDRFGGETSWTLKNKAGTTVLEAGNVAAFQTDTQSKSLPAGDYTFKITDKSGDGLVGQKGDTEAQKGYYSISIANQMVHKKTNFAGGETLTIKIGYVASMTQRDMLFLQAHNTRRKKWHKTTWGLKYRPLQWAPSLKTQAVDWAKKVADEVCFKTKLTRAHHCTACPEAENIAARSGGGSWGEPRDPEQVLWNFVDREEPMDAPANGHLTNALWRPTLYVGCGEAKRTSGEKSCYIEVCRYVRAGNCQLDKSTEPKKYDLVKQDWSSCGPDAPSEGVYFVDPGF